MVRSKSRVVCVTVRWLVDTLLPPILSTLESISADDVLKDQPKPSLLVEKAASIGEGEAIVPPPSLSQNRYDLSSIKRPLLWTAPPRKDIDIAVANITNSCVSIEGMPAPFTVASSKRKSIVKVKFGGYMPRSSALTAVALDSNVHLSKKPHIELETQVFTIIPPTLMPVDSRGVL
jgi:hypothetical protein